MKLVDKILIFSLFPILLIVLIAVINLQSLSEEIKTQMQSTLAEKAQFILYELKQKQNNISHIADILSNAMDVISAAEMHDVDLLYRWGRLFLDMEPERITIVDKDGVVLSRAHSEFEFGDNIANSSIFLKAKEKDRVDDIIFDPNPKFISTRKILKFDEIIIGYLIVELDIDEKLLSKIGKPKKVLVKITKEEDLHLNNSNIISFPSKNPNISLNLSIKELENNKEDELKALQRKIVIGALFLAILVVLVIYLFVKETLKPVEILVAKMRSYAKNEISVDELIKVAEVLSTQKNEIGQISLSFKETLQRLQETQKQLIESEKMSSLGTLVTGVAHEINTPIGVCITATSYLQEQLGVIKDEFEKGSLRKSALSSFLNKFDDAIKTTISNLNRASSLINSFKEVSVDQYTETLREFDLENYLTEIIISLKPKLRKSKHQLYLLCNDTIVMKSYPGALSQVFTNLIINSLIHGFENKESGTMAIVVWDNQDSVLIEYIDDGKGMSYEVLRQIFDPFFTTKRGQGGTGLGMHIVYNLITQKLKGTINCESTEGIGSRFLIEIPKEVSEI